MPYSSVPARNLSSNRLINSLPEDEREYLCSHLEDVYLANRESVYDQDALIRYVYFPLDCVISAVALMNDGATVEVGMVGREGVVGVVSIFGEYHARHWTQALVSGRALRIEAEPLKRLFIESDSLRPALMRTYHSIVTQISQRAICNGRHTVLQRLSCWLLMVNDRKGAAELQLTQETISHSIGARRAGITESAHTLQQTGAISYVRGRISINDRRPMEEMACECYKVHQEEFNSLTEHGAAPAHHLIPLEVTSPCD